MPAPVVITDAEISGLLKNVYSDVRTEIFPRSTPLLSNVKKGGPGGPMNLRWGGNGVYGDAVLSRPVGLTASQSGYLAKDAAATERQFTLGIKRLYVTRQLDGLVVTGTNSKEAAFISIVRKVLGEAKAAFELGMQEVLHGDGRGIKALIGSVTDTDTIVVTSPYGVASSGRGGLLLDKGMHIAVLDATDSFATVLGRATISSATNSGDNVTLELASTIAGMAAGDAIVACTDISGGDTSFNNYPNGLMNIGNRGGSYDNFEGINAATAGNERWNTVRMTAGTDTPDSSAPTESDIYDLIMKVAGRCGHNARSTPKEFLLLTTPGIEKKLAESFLGQRRFDMGSKVELEGGWEGVNICGVACVSDVWCPRGTVYLVHLPSLVWVDAKDFGQVQFEDSGAWRFISGRDAFETSMGVYTNFGTANRAAFGMISGYVDTADYGFVV
jgi:hypothetical protein